MALTNLVTSLVLDVYDHDTTPTTVKAIALDKQTRYIKATLTYRGADYPVDENATVTLTVIRPDKTGVQVTGSVADVDNADRTGTIKGVYAELSQAALAVKGNLKAQFMVSVGDQILRTEIFSIKNGEALDADVSEWAGEYQGYNLDELVENVNSAVATVNEMESDVSDLNEGLTSITTPPVNLFDSKFEMGWINYANGIEEDSTNYIRTASYIAVEPNTQYVMYNNRDKLYGTSINPCQTVVEYDSEKGVLRYADVYTSKFSTGANTCFIRFISNRNTSISSYLDQINSYSYILNTGSIIYQGSTTDRGIAYTPPITGVRSENLYYGLYDIDGFLTGGAWNYWADGRAVATLPMEVSGADLYVLCDNSAENFDLWYGICYASDGSYLGYVSQTVPVASAGTYVKRFTPIANTRYIIIETPTYTRASENYTKYRTMIEGHLIVTENRDYAWSKIYRDDSNIINASLVNHGFKNDILNTEIRAFIEGGLEDFVTSVNASGYDLVVPVMTDIHTLWREPYAILNYLARCGACDLVVNLGDNIPDHFSTKAETANALNSVFAVSNNVPTLNSVVNIRGNHDTNPVNSTISDSTNMVQTAEFYSLSRSRLVSGFVSRKGYGYVDVVNAKVRIVFLDTSDIFDDSGTPVLNGNDTLIGQDQLDWFANVALKIDKADKNEWSVVTMAHDRLSVLSTNDIFGRLLNAFTDGTSLNATDTRVVGNISIPLSVNVDYTSQGQMTYVCHVNGHYHEDNVVTFGDGFKQISVPSDVAPARYFENNVRKTYTRTPQTIEEHCFDAFCISKATRKIYMERFGVGADRSFTY